MEIKKFNHLTVKKDFHLLILDKNNHFELITSIINKMARNNINYDNVNFLLDKISIVCSNDLYDYYSEKYPTTKIIRHTEKYLREILSRQQVAIDIKKNIQSDLCVSDTIILDNETDLDKLSGSDPIKEVILNGKNNFLSYILKLESIDFLEKIIDDYTKIRSKIDYIIISFQNISTDKTNQTNLHKIYSIYQDLFKNYQTFEKLTTLCKNNHSAMVIDNTNSSLNIPDRIFYTDY